jgi:protein ImuB
LFACLYQPPGTQGLAVTPGALVALAGDFSPRYQCHRDDLVIVDICGLDRLLGDPRSIGEEIRRSALVRGLRVHVGIATTRTAAMVLALARPGLTVVPPGREADAIAPMAIGILEKISDVGTQGTQGTRGTESSQKHLDQKTSPVSVFKRWGMRTLGELAALPSSDLSARLGRQGLAWQAIARGQDVGPLVPTLAAERFESSIELEWPIDGLEPLSFVLTRLLEPLSTRLERRDRGAAAIHVLLGLVTTPDIQRETQPGEAGKAGGAGEAGGIGRASEAGEAGEPVLYTRSLQLPSPIRDVRALRTLILLDLESHPPAAPIERVTVILDPTPGRVLQHTLFVRAHPTPEQLSTLIARLNALMGEDRVGRPARVDSYRPGAFAMRPFATDQDWTGRAGGSVDPPRQPASSSVVSVLRRCRQPVPARVVVAGDRPGAVTTDRRGFTGGRVLACAGPWRSSGEWWTSSWNRDEWDVSLSDGAVYRIFQDRDTNRWFIDAIVD